MKITYIPLKSAVADVFKKIIAKKEEEDYSTFIESLKSVDPNDLNIIAEIKKVLKELAQNKEVESEILKRLEDKDGTR